VVYTIAAYIAFVLMTNAQTSAPIAVLGALFGATMLGLLIEVSVFRPLRRRRGSSVIFLLASLGVVIALQNCVSIIFGDGLRSLPGLTVRSGYLIAGARITSAQIVIILVGFGVFILTDLGLRYTRLGRALRAIANDKELSQVVGIDSEKMVLVAFLLGSFLVGSAGVLIAFDTGLQPMMGFSALLFGVVAIVVGGVGKTTGAFWGGIIIGMAQQISAWVLPSKWQDAIVFVILIGFLLFRPQGLFGTPLRKISV